ncbi:MAG TPA: PIN domain-containing protein [Tepidisphaeraceae bacterium]|jgi:hypothetical protein
MLYAFVDTNVLIHYHPLGDMDWCDICGVEEVTIVLCLPVLDELDKHKNNLRLAERASKRVKEVREIKTKRDSKINKNVTLEIYSASMRATEFDDTLDPSNMDERIVQLVRKFAQERKADVALITEDIGMSVRADAHQIKVIEPPESQRLPNPMSDEQRQLLAVQREFTELKNRRPKLSITLLEPSFVLRRRKPWDVAALVEQANQLVQKKFERQRPLRTYKAQLDRYLAGVERFCETQNTVADESCRTFELYGTLWNEGKAAAKDVTITIDFPDQITGIFYDQHLFGNRTRPLKMPDENRVFQLQPPVVQPVPHNLNVTPYSPPTIGTFQGNQFQLHMPLIAQGHEQAPGPFYLTFGSWQQVGRIAAQVKIISIDPPDTHEYPLPIEVTVAETPEEPPEAKLGSFGGGY